MTDEFMRKCNKLTQLPQIGLSLPEGRVSFALSKNQAFECYW